MTKTFSGFVAVAAALVASTLVVGATASHAQAPGFYSAVPVAKPGKTSFIARETVWTWQNDAYTARRGGDRDAIQCELVAKQAGKLASFSAGGAAFDSAALDKCNARAK